MKSFRVTMIVLAAASAAFLEATQDSSRAGTAQPAAQPAPKAANELNGCWEFVKAEGNPPPGVGRWPNGGPFRKGPLQDGICIENDVLRHTTKENLLAPYGGFAIATDATRTPKTIDFKEGTTLWLGIYKLERGELTIATNFSGDKRPESFATELTAGASRAYHVRTYKFVPPTAADVQAKKQAPLDPKTQILDGYWTLKQREENGETHANFRFVKDDKIYIEGRKWLFLTGRDRGQLSEPLTTLRFDPAATPPSLDLSAKRDDNSAIYKIEDDKLWIASNHGTGVDRPTMFTTKLTAGVGRAELLRVYERIRPSDREAKLMAKVKVDPKTQSLSGLWILDEQSRNVAPRTDSLRFGFNEAVYFDKGIWSHANVKGIVTDKSKTRFKSDAAQPIPTIEMQWDGQTIRGIYKIENDLLYFASKLNDDPLPTTFTTSPVAGPQRANYAAIFHRAAK